MSVENIVLSLAVGMVVLLVGVPVVAVMLLTLFDIIFRVDTGISKVFWLAAVMMMPVAGLLLYWLFRPKRFNPLEEKEELRRSVPVYPRPASISQGQKATQAPTPIGGPTPPREDEPGLPQAA